MIVTIKRPDGKPLTLQDIADFLAQFPDAPRHLPIDARTTLGFKPKLREMQVETSPQP